MISRRQILALQGSVACCLAARVAVEVRTFTGLQWMEMTPVERMMWRYLRGETNRDVATYMRVAVRGVWQN